MKKDKEYFIKRKIRKGIKTTFSVLLKNLENISEFFLDLVINIKFCCLTGHLDYFNFII